METKKDKLLFVGFNQDNQCFSVGTNRGFRIYNTEPFSLNFERGNKYFINFNQKIQSCSNVHRNINGNNVI